MYTGNLRNKLKQYMVKNNTSSFYGIEKITGIHRQSIKTLFEGGGLNYETGMKLKKFFADSSKDEQEEVEKENKPVEHTPGCIHFPCTCGKGKKYD